MKNKNVTMKTSIILLASILLCMGCSKKSDPSPTTSGSGSWTYRGITYTGTSATWVSNTLISMASKPSSSGLEAAFSSATPAAGDYSISTNGQVAANQTIISVVDASLPAIAYSSIDADAGKVSVSRSGGSTTITVTNIKLKGFTANAVLDSIYVTGTIVK